MSRSSASFEEDMRLIRERRNISREMLHEQTKIALENIELFEEGELDRHSHFNDVYLRALVRAYAEVLDMSKERVLQGLERARSGTYRGELGNLYLDRGGSGEEPEDEADQGGPPSQEDEREPGAGAGESRRPENSDTGVGTRGDVENDKPAEDVPTSEDPELSSSQPLQALGSERSGAHLQRAKSSRATGGGIGEWLTTGGMGKIALGTAAVLLVVLIVWAVTAVLPSSSPSSVAAKEGSATVDTVQVGAEGEADDTLPPVAVIGDSLEVTVIAADGKLEPIRIKRDEGPWNPYWLEEGDSMSFAALERFAVRSYLPRARVRIESLEWPIRATNRYDTLVVSRERVQQYIDSLSAAPSR